MRRAKVPRRLQLAVGDVDGDDRGGAGDARALDAVEPDAAAADHNDARPGGNGGRVDDGAQSRQHAAGDQRRAVELHVLRDDRDLALVDHDMLGEGARAHAMHERLALGAVQRRLDVEREHFLAEDGRPAGAGRAAAAGADQRRDDGIADLHALDAQPDRLDHARRLMAVDRRQVAAPGAVEIENVAVTDCAGGQLDPDFARTGIGEFHLFDAEGRAEGAADGGSGFHGFLSPIDPIASRSFSARSL